MLTVNSNKGIQFITTILMVIISVSCIRNKNVANGLSENVIPELETGSLKPMPDQWIDKSTGHKIIKLSRREGGSESFYFHNNPFISGTKNKDDMMVFYGRVDSLMQLFKVNLSTLEIKQITYHPGRIWGEIVARNGRKVFYQNSDSVFATNIDTKETRLIYVFPSDFKGHIASLNANEKLLGGVFAPPLKGEILRKYPGKKEYFKRIFEARIPHTLFTIDINSGKLTKLDTQEAWLNHIQFSPTNPDLMMFAHEGPWHFVDRIWTMDINTTKSRLMHTRNVGMEIAGHEFFSRDGKIIWFDLQIPRGENFFLAGTEIETGKTKKYHLTQDEWSVHFNISPDQKLFAGDGGDSTQVAHATNGKWIYLYTPSGDSLLSEKLVDMKHHSYRSLEPNVHFSPDGGWVIFKSDFDGEVNIYAVEIEKPKTKQKT
jgi:oligogalacturonide lyase